MSEMVERVARVLHAMPSEAWSYVPWSVLQAMHKERLMRQARTAIEAMREPTPRMVDEAYAVMSYEDDADRVWRLMIDAALSTSKLGDE